jgi:hypothetical protein
MAMSSSELLRRRQEEANKYISRAKVRDSSEVTLINQAKASKNYLPTTVSSIVSDGDSCARLIYIRGNGTNMTYTNVLQGKQGCAVCADDDPVVNRVAVLPTPCYDRRKAPFAQQDLSGNVGSGGVVYQPACTPGFVTYFPTEPNRGPTCTLPHLPYDSA